MPGCRLIVHADDFGLSEKVNEGIIRAYRHGILTSASLMAPARAFEHAVALYRSTSELDLGIHLTLTEEKPVLPKKAVGTLLDIDGRFHSHATTFIRKYGKRQISLSEVHKELDAQIRKVLDSGVNVSHLDGHQHIHMLPKIWRICVGLAKKYGILAVRFPRERVCQYMLSERGVFSRVPALLVLNILCALGRKSDVLHTDTFCGFYFGGNLHKGNLLKVLEHLPEGGTCELMCHPGLDDSAGCYNHWKYQWSAELDALLDPEISHFLRERNVDLISYRALIVSERR